MKFSTKKWGEIFFWKKDQTRGGVRGRFGKRPYFSRIFFSAPFPYAFVPLCLASLLMSGYSRTWAIRLFQYQQYRATADPPIIHREKIAVRKYPVSQQ